MRPLIIMLRTSSTIRSLKTLLLLMNVTKSDEIGISGGGDYEDETVKKLPCMPKNLDRVTDYLISNARLAFT